MAQIILFAKQKQRHRGREQTYGHQGGKGGVGGMKRETGVDTYTLWILRIKQITNENLLYRTGNSIQRSLVTQMGRKFKREGTGVYWVSLVAQTVKNPPAMQETWVQSLHWEDLLKEEMEIHSSILAWEIPQTEEPGRLQFMVS